MKNLIFILLAQLIAMKSFAQGNFEKYDINVEFISEPSVSNGDNGINLYYNSETENNYKFKILARSSRNKKGKDDQYAESTYLKLKYVTNGNTIVIADKLGLFYIADGLTQSPYREFTIEIPATIQTDGQIVGEFYTKNSDNTVKESKTISNQLVAKVFNGPSTICTEEVFTLGGHENATLENATGVATITNLGNKQWKITRMGTSSGVAKLVSTIGPKKFSKDIVVGTIPPTISGGATTVWSGNTYYYNVIKTDPTSTLNIDEVSGPGLPYTITVVGNQIKLTTLSIGSDVNDYIIRLRASETNSCGTSSIKTLSVRFKGGEGPIQ